MVDAALFFSFSAGSAAFLNPCGVGLLPAYISYYVGREEETSSRLARGLRGLFLGLMVSLGFLAVFTLAGLAFVAISPQILSYASLFSVSIGSLVVILGIMMFFGKGPGISTLNRLGMRLKRIETRSEPLTFFIFGIGYALASLACTIPLFLVAVSSAFGLGLQAGILSFFAYAAGMSVFMIVVSVGVAVAKEAVSTFLSEHMRAFTKGAALLIIIAGLFVIWTQLQTFLL